MQPNSKFFQIVFILDNATPFCVKDRRYTFPLTVADHCIAWRPATSPDRLSVRDRWDRLAKWSRHKSSIQLQLDKLPDKPTPPFNTNKTLISIGHIIKSNSLSENKHRYVEACPELNAFVKTFHSSKREASFQQNFIFKKLPDCRLKPQLYQKGTIYPTKEVRFVVITHNNIIIIIIENQLDLF